MDRAYVGADASHGEALEAARSWAGTRAVLIGPSTQAIEAWPPIVRAGIALGTVGSRASRYSARPAGTVIAWCLSLDEVLDLEARPGVEAVVVTQADRRHRTWVTAHHPECLAGSEIVKVAPASDAVVRLVRGLTGIAVTNQGLVDRRERDEANQALMRFAELGVPLDPDALAVEAMRNGWPGRSPLELADLARSISAGKRPRYAKRLRPDVVDSWATGSDKPDHRAPSHT